MSVVLEVLELFRTAKGPLTLPELAARTKSSPALVKAALEELSRRGKLQRSSLACKQAACTLKGKCPFKCASCGKAAPATCTQAWRLVE